MMVTMMMTMREGDEFERSRNGLVQAVIDLYGGRAGMGKNVKMEFSESEKRPSRASELHLARKNMTEIYEKTRLSETVKASAEMELLEAKKTVKDLAFQIEETNFKVRRKVQVVRKINVEREGGDRRAMEDSRMESDHQHAEVMRELESAKQELINLKLDIARITEEKTRAEKEMNFATARTQSSSLSLKDLSKEVEEANEEHVLVELAMMEAIKELADIEAQKKQEHRNFSLLVEDKKQQMSILKVGIHHVKELELALEATNSEIEVIKNELNFIEEIEKIPDTETSDASDEKDEKSSEFNVVLGELEARKTELELLRQEGLQSMISMDATMNELEFTVEEIKRLKSQGSKQEKVIGKLNSRLQRMQEKLDAEMTLETTTTGILSTMSTGLDQLRTSAETAKAEKELMVAETLSIKSDVKELEDLTELHEEQENDAVDKLKQAVKSEAVVMEKLRILTESTMKGRASAAKTSSTIIISKFEYDYLRGHAAIAGKVADKKIEAAEACIKALKKSEVEMSMEIGKAQAEVRELSLQEETELKIAESSSTMRESIDQKLKQSKSVELTMMMELSKKTIITDDGGFTPSLLSKQQKPAPRSSRLSSFTLGRLRKGMTD